MPVGPFVPESKTGVPKIAERVGFRPRRQTGATLRAGLDGTPAPGTGELRP